MRRMSWLKQSDPVQVRISRQPIQVPRRSISAPPCMSQRSIRTKIPTSRFAASEPSREICTVWPIGSSSAAYEQSRWNPPGSNGSQRSSSSISVASRSFWSMRGMPSTSLAVRLTSAMPTGCSGCTPLVCFEQVSDRKAKSRPCVPISVCVSACWTLQPPTSSTCRKR